MNAIIAEGIEMVFESGGNRYHALQGIDLQLSSGNIQLLMGPSGSGKTTLLTILAGLLAPSAGKVRLLGQEITRFSKAQLTKFRRDNLGFVFQGFNLFPALSAAENIEVALNLKGIRSKCAHHEARILLDTVGLTDQGHLLPAQLSGGQKQRVAIARALAGNPRLIMADEPTAALDSHSGQAVIELLHQLAKERHCSVLVVTHDPRIVSYADDILYLEDGQIQPAYMGNMNLMPHSA